MTRFVWFAPIALVGGAVVAYWAAGTVAANAYAAGCLVGVVVTGWVLVAAIRDGAR